MNRIFQWIFAIAILMTGLAIHGQSTTRVEGLRRVRSQAFAFTGATVVVSPGNVVENATLLLRDGRVESVRSGGAVPNGYTDHDLTGYVILPGFVDPYTEYGLSGVGDLNEKKDSDGPKYVGTRVGPDAWNDAIHAEREWVESFEPSSDAAESLMKRGVTTVQSVKMDGIFRGRGFVTLLADGLANDQVLKARANQFLSFDKGSSKQSYPSSLMGSIALIRQSFFDAEWLERAGARERVEVNEALRAIADYEGPWIFEGDDVLDTLRVGRLAKELGIEVVHVGKNDTYERLDAVKALGNVMILPLTLPDTPSVRTIGADADVDLKDLRHWEWAPGSPAMMADGGIRFAFTGHGVKDADTFFANLRTVVERGLPADAALAALTTVPAEIAGVADWTGSLDRGRLANFLVVDGDLFTDDEAEITEVWIDGERVLELEPRDRRDLRGTYQVSVGGEMYELRVTGESDKPKGVLVRGDREVDVADLESTLDALSFTVPMDELGLEGTARFSVQAIADEISGEVMLPGGMPISTVFKRRPDEPEPAPEVAEETEGNETTKAEEAVLSEVKIVSRLTSPNLAWGYESYPEQETVVVRSATIWTLDGEGKIEDADILVSGGKIRAIGRDLDAGSAREIDASGKHVTPGMIDEHSHLAISRGVNEGSHAVTAEVRIGDVVDPGHIGVYRALAGGTTTAQLLHGSANPIGGQAQVVKFRWGVGPEEMKFASAPPSIKFALGENVKQSNWGDDYTSRYPQTRSGVYTIMKDRFLEARDYANGWKEWNAMSRRERERSGASAPRRDLQLEALAEILASERFVHSHSYVQSEILMLMRLAEELGFRIQTFTHILEGYKVAPEMAKHGAGGSTFSDWWAYKFEVYDAIPTNPCLMHAAGVVTSINSDSSELIRRLNQEAAKSVMYCGMDEIEALRMATLNPAKQLKIDKWVGSLETGKDADFVIWSGHPLSTFSKAEQTWVDGRAMFTIERDAELREMVVQERDALIQKILRAGKDDDSESSESDEVEEPEDWHCDDLVDVWAVGMGGSR